VKDVADGYARNFLLPRQLVTPATASELANLRQKVAAAQRRVEKQRAENEALAARIEDIKLTFEVRVGRGDRLYGSVTSQDIANALVEQEHLTIDRRIIQLHEPLRQLGDFEVGLRVAPGIEPKLKVSIIPSEGSHMEEE
jgi:large subunit ribosomal protein L9